MARPPRSRKCPRCASDLWSSAGKCCGQCGTQYARAMSVPLAIALIVGAAGLLLFGTCSSTVMGTLGGGADVAMIVLFIVTPVVIGVLLGGYAIRSLRAPAEQVGFPIEPRQEEQKAATKDTNEIRASEK